MRATGQKKFFHVAGKATRKKDRWLSYDMETMMQAIALHLQMLGLPGVGAVGSDTLHFEGMEWQGNLFAYFSSFAMLLKRGTVTIALEGPMIAANYLVRPSAPAIGARLAALGAFAVYMLIKAGETFDLGIMLISLLVILGIAPLFFGLSMFLIHRGMKKELTSAFATAEKVIESRSRDYDTSLVDPEHQEAEPQTLARLAFYYRDQNMKEKSRSYFALILKLYPWTEEASTAFNELRKD